MNKLEKISLSLLPLLPGTNLLAQQQPNVLFILVDDMGYTDLACTGSKVYETPNINQLAEEGMAFNAAYAACPVSSPSRAALMTGKYPARVNLTDYIPGNQAYGPHRDQLLASQPFNQHLEHSEVTIGKAFQQYGYATFFAGKWHLADKEEFYPASFGFDVCLGGNHTGHPAGGYFSPYRNPQLPDGPKGEYLTDRLTDETIRYIKSAPKDKPFFAYLSYYTVHLPMQAKPEKIEKYRKKLAAMQFEGSEFDQQGKIYHKNFQNMATYAAMVEHLDDNVGRLMRTLKEEGLDKNTIVVFTSDNGGMAACNTQKIIPTSNLPLRAGKGYLYEGGIRVPLFVRWPGVVPSHSVSNVAVTGTDYYPTLLDLCGLPLLKNQHKDGVSFKAALKGKDYKRPPLFWHYPHYSGGLGGRPSGAIRLGDYKLIEFFEDQHVELYNVVNDVSETQDLSTQEPKLVAKMLKKLHKWQKEVKALMPVKNEHYKS